MIGRRIFVAGLFTAPLAARTAAQGRKPVLALLLAGSETASGSNAWPVAIRKALADLGWIEGRNIEIVTRFAEFAFDRLPALAAELVVLKPDVVVTHSSEGARAAAGATSTIPVIVGAAVEATMIEIAGGLARPKGNVTGLTVASDEQHAKCVELLKQLHPAARRIGVLVNPLSKAYRDYPTPLVGALAPLGLEFVRAEAGRGQASLIEAFATLATASVDAVIVTADPTFNQPPMDRYISELARARRLAVAGMFEGLVRAGGTLCLATDYQALIRRSAVYVDKILKGAKPGDLPIERPSVFQVIVNLQAARRLGIEVPPAILLRADEVIE